jgi:hypothetical protein
MGADDRPAGLAMSLGVDDVDERVHEGSFRDVMDELPPEDLDCDGRRIDGRVAREPAEVARRRAGMRAARRRRTWRR